MTLTLIAFLFVLGLLVLFHEFGHFLASKLLGIRVLKFSFGFGPKLVGFTKGGTEYLISAVPLGGYVKPEGDNPETMDDEHPDPKSFLFRPWWVKALVALAGPVMNIVLAFLLLVAVYLLGIKLSDYTPLVGTVKPNSLAAQKGLQEEDQIVGLNGKPISTWNGYDALWDTLVSQKVSQVLVRIRHGQETRDIPLTLPQERDWLKDVEYGFKTRIGEVNTGYPAYQAGIQVGDSIVAINGQRMEKWSEVSNMIHSHPNQELDLSLMRRDKPLEIRVRTYEEDLPGLGRVGLIGVSPAASKTFVRRFSAPDAIQMGAVSTLGFVAVTYTYLYRLALQPSKLRTALGGPIAIASASGQQARKGFTDLLWLAAWLSVALAVFNLLPIPILDGALILFSLVEWLRRKRLSLKWQINFQRVGFALILALMAFTFVNDIAREATRQLSLRKNQKTMERPEK
jgi:regulator of sigma E protease